MLEVKQAATRDSGIIESSAPSMAVPLEPSSSARIVKNEARKQSNRKRIRDGWAAKESVLRHFLAVDGYFQWKKRSVPLVVRCMLMSSTSFGVIGSFSYMIGAIIRRDSIVPNMFVVFTGGVVSGCTSGFLLYVFPSCTTSNSSRVIAQSLFLQIFMLSVLTFIATPSVGSFILHATNSWQDMLVNQFIGVGFVLILLFLGLFIYRRHASPQSKQRLQSSLLTTSTGTTDDDENVSISQGLQMNPLNSSQREPSLSTGQTIDQRKKRDRSLPFLGGTKQNVASDIRSSHHNHESSSNSQRSKTNLIWTGIGVETDIYTEPNFADK
jgi:hypothetical protein